MLSRSNTVSSRNSESQLGPPYIQDLSESQLQALKDLRCRCFNDDIFWHVKDVYGSNDDITLIRYLKARNWQVGAALKQYSITVTWRRKMELDSRYENADVAQFKAVSRLMPQWTGRRTKEGIPLFVYSVAKIRPYDLLTTSKADPSLSSVFLPAEYSTRFVQPVCAALHPSQAMPRLTHIIDLNGVGVRHLWSLRSHLQKAAGMATNHYPESVDKIFIIGAPSFFPTIWGYITKWFDPTITCKISILPAGTVRDVLIDCIDPSELPIAFGGCLDWEYGMPPDFDVEIQSLLNSTGEDWTDGPLIFESAHKRDLELVGVDTLSHERARCISIARLTQASIYSDTR